MADFSAALAPLTTSPTLWLAPAVPLAAAAWAAWSAGADEAARAASDRARAWATALAALGALALVAPHAVSVLSAAAPSTVVSSAGPMARIGSFELAFTVSVDATSAPTVLAVALAGALLAGVAAAAADAPTRARTAGHAVALSGTLLAALADSAPVHALGVVLGGTGAAVLARRARPVALAAVAGLMALCGSVVFAWALAGSFAGGEIVVDPRPRLVAVEIEGPAAPGATEGWLTLAAFPGARVNLGGATLCETSYEGARGGLGAASRPCRVPAEAPFARLAVPAAMQELRIDAGPGLDELLVSRARVTAGRETRVVALGATFSPREIETQLGLRAENGGRPVREAVAGRRLGAVAAPPVAICLLALGWLLAIFGTSSAAGPWLAVAGAAGAARWAGACALAPDATWGIALAAAAGALVYALLAFRARTLAEAAARAVASAAALGVAAAVVGAPAAAATIVASALCAGAALSLDPGAWRAWGPEPGASSVPAERRTGTLALALLAGAPLPVGVALGREELVARAFTEPSLTSLGVAALVALTALLGAAGAWRARGLSWSDVANPAAAPQPSHPRYASVASALAALAFGLGAAGTGIVDGAASWLHVRLPPETHALLPGPAPPRLAVALLGCAVAVAGAWWAWRAYGARRAREWGAREQSIPGVAWLDALLEAGGVERERRRAESARALAERWTSRLGGPPPEDASPAEERS